MIDVERDMKRSICLILWSILLLIGVAVAEESAYDIPWDIDFPNYSANQFHFTETSYHDESLDVRLETGKCRGVTYYAAYFQVKSPTQLRTAVAGRPNENVVMLPSQLARDKKAVLALNGEYYIQRSRDIFIYRQGVEYRSQPDPEKDVLIIDDAGDFHIFIGENKAAEIQAFQDAGGKIINAFSFGPALVKDGEPVKYREDYYFKPKERTGRSAVAQVSSLSYAFIYCPAATQKDMYDIAATLDLQQAYNLDGGNSSILIFNDSIIGGKRKNTEREQSDILYVVSAIKGG